MNSTSLDRFNKRKKLKNTITVYDDVDENLVNQFLNSKVDNEKVDNFFKSTSEFYSMDVSDKEAKEFLEKYKKDFNQERFDKLIIDCRKEVINSIVTPFGLGKIVAAYDKVGGNVTTIHNANQKIYAKQEDEYNRKDYTNTKNSNGQQFAGDSKNSVGSNFTKSKMDDDKNVVDAYTGKIQKADTTSPDHVESLSQYHKDGGFMQSNTQKANFATDENNLALTDRSINQSMRDFDKEEWKHKESEKGLKNKDKFELDEQKLNNELNKAKEIKEKHLPTNLEKGQYYVKNSALTGVNEGLKMGMQQAIGLIMSEFFTALFDEILDIYKNGFSNGFEDDRFFTVLKERIINIAKKIQTKWKDVAIAFKDGILSGFISNFVTTIVNIFATTWKRFVRIIREGILSLFKAIKILIFPPKDLTFEEAMHEAKKIIATGLIVSLGVLLEEAVSKFLSGIPFSNMLTSIFVGALTGIAITMTVYYIDKKKNDKDAKEMLREDTRKTYANIDRLLRNEGLN